MQAFTQYYAGPGVSTVLPDMDFETYSEAGYVWDEANEKWQSPRGLAATAKGIKGVGAAAYAMHPSCEVTNFSYDLKDGVGPREWWPGLPNPQELFDYLARPGALIEAWNVSFECWVWSQVCVKKYGWPPLDASKLRCAMAKSRAFALPGKLEKAGEVLALDVSDQKDPDGQRLIKKFACPRTPTKKNKSLRVMPADAPDDFTRYRAYNRQDIKAEAAVSIRCPDLSPSELEFWKVEQAINRRGVKINLPLVRACMDIIEQAYEKYNKELFALTGGHIGKASEAAKILQWLAGFNIFLDDLKEETVADALKIKTLPDAARRVLEIRQATGSASVKKVFAMAAQATQDWRLHDLFVYHSAHTGREAGAGPQPHNLPSKGPMVILCGLCKKHYGVSIARCPYCRTPASKPIEWNWKAADDALEIIKAGSLELLEWYFPRGFATVSACLRGLFIADEGKEFICSDYSAIEAVALAMVAGEQWRIDLFREQGDIYEASASRITGVPLSEFDEYRRKNAGSKHPLRKKIGKIAELASGYQGWIGAWKQFGADEYFDDDEIKEHILAWRKASPAIVELWGGQFRGYGRDKRPEMYGLEGAAISAVQYPGKEFKASCVSYFMQGDALYCRLPSGRLMTYHRPRLRPSDRGGLSLSYEGWNTNPKNGPSGWIRKDTWGGRLCENIIQAICRDILAYAMVNLEKAGYPIVLHVHDEIVAEVLKGWGSIKEFERIMSDLPTWAKGWPIFAKGGWRGPNYRKD